MCVPLYVCAYVCITLAVTLLHECARQRDRHTDREVHRYKWYWVVVCVSWAEFLLFFFWTCPHPFPLPPPPPRCPLLTQWSLAALDRHNNLSGSSCAAFLLARPLSQWTSWTAPLHLGINLVSGQPTYLSWDPCHFRPCMELKLYQHICSLVEVIYRI